MERARSFTASAAPVFEKMGQNIRDGSVKLGTNIKESKFGTNIREGSMKLGSNISETTKSWKLGEKMSSLMSNVRAKFTKKKDEPVGEVVEEVQVVEDKPEVVEEKKE